MPEIPVIDNAARRAARNWIDTVAKANKWRVAVLSRRYRKDPKTGRRVSVPLRIRRFVEGCPAAGVVAAIDYLLESAPYTGVVFNGQTLQGSYRPTLTEWRRDDQTTMNSARNRTDGTYTLVQDLVEDGEKDSWSGGTAGSCTERVETEYVWDASAIEDLPDPEQGVTYAIQSVGRSEDGTFSYVLVKRTALTQVGAETTASDGAYETVATRTYRNLYGDPETGFTDDSGASVDVAKAGNGVDVQTKQNDDCTYDVVVQTKTGKPITSEESSSEVIDERTSSVTRRAQADPLGRAPDAKDGVIKTHKDELRPDGLYDTTEQTKTEQAVDDAVKVVTVSRKGTRTTTVSRNQAVAASTSGLSVGTEVRVEKTPGRLYNNTVTTWNKETMKVGVDCEDDAFRHVDENTEAVSSLPDGHVSAGSAGKSSKRSAAIDDDGAIIQTTKTTQEKTVKAAVTQTEVTLRGRRVTTVNRSMPAAASAPTAIGSSVRNEMTAGGWYDQTIVAIGKKDVGELRTECVKTGLEHRDSKTSNVTSKPKSEATAVKGKIVEKTVAVTEYGTYDVTDTTRTPTPYSDVLKFGTVNETVESTALRNASKVAVSPGGVNVETRASATRNDFGLFDGTVSTTKFLPKTYGPLKYGSATATVSETDGKNATAIPGASPGGVNVTTSLSASLNGHGSYDYSLRTTNHVPLNKRTGSSSMTLRSSSHSAGTNSVAPPSVTVGVNQSVTLSPSLNDHGSVDWSSRVDTYHPYGPVTVADCSGVVKRVRITSAYNQTSPTYGGTIDRNCDVSVSASLNEHASFDRTVTVTEYKPQGPFTLVQYSNPMRTTTIRAAYHQLSCNPQLPGSGAVNTEVAASASMDDRGGFDWTSRIETYQPWGPKLVSTVTTPVQTVRTYIGANLVAAKSMASGSHTTSSISASLNSHGSFDTTETVTTPSPLSKEVTWTVANNKANKDYKMIVYRNQDKPLVVSGNYLSSTASSSINQFGLCDGYAISVTGSESSSSSGGSSEAAGGIELSDVLIVHGPGGVAFKRVVKMTGNFIVGTAQNVAGWASGGYSYGGIRSGIVGSAGYNSAGQPLVIVYKFREPKFEAATPL